MGALATWGAVAGVAKGWQQNIERGEKEQAAQIDADREMALERLKAKNAERLESMRQQGASERNTASNQTTRDVAAANIEGRMDVAQFGAEATQSRQDDQQAWLTEENRLDRESRERIAKIAAGASAASQRAALERFEPRVLKVGETPPGAPPGYTVEVDTPAVYDKEAGMWYVQEGNRYVLPGTKPEQIARAPQAAIDYLFSHPDQASGFIKPRSEGGYGYLPMGFLQTLKVSPGQGGMLQTGRDATE